MTIYFLIALSVVQFAFLFYYYDKYQKSKKELKDFLKKPKNRSEELTEFLQDQQNFGYSFVRVDPLSVMVRSPRD